MINERMQQLAGVPVNEAKTSNVYVSDPKVLGPSWKKTNFKTTKELIKFYKAKGFEWDEDKKFETLLAQGKDAYVYIDPYAQDMGNERWLFVDESKKKAEERWKNQVGDI